MQHYNYNRKKLITSVKNHLIIHYDGNVRWSSDHNYWCDPFDFRVVTEVKMLRALILLALINTAFTEIQVKLYNTKCNFNPKFVANGTCTLKMISRNQVVSNVEYDLVHTMKNVSFHLRLFKFYSQFRVFLVNEWVGLCKAVSDKGLYNFFVKTFMRVITRFSNSVICLHKPNKHYYFRNIVLPEEVFKKLLEIGKYKLTVDVYEGVPIETVGNYSISLDIFENYGTRRLSKNWWKFSGNKKHCYFNKKHKNKNCETSYIYIYCPENPSK